MSGTMTWRQRVVGIVVAVAALAMTGVQGAAASPLAPAAVVGAVTGSVPVASITGAGPAPVIERVAGPSRYDVSASLSARTFAPGVPVAYVTSGEKFSDALSGAPVAARDKAPLLLTLPDSVPAPLDAELRRLRPARIVVLGGPLTVSDEVVTLLRAYATSGTVERLSGASRYEVSASLSERTFAPGGWVFLASGEKFPDALAGGPAAATKDAPVLLTLPDYLPDATRAELERLKPSHIIILGGSVHDGVYQAAKTLAPTVRRITGRDRYTVAANIQYEFFSMGTSAVYVAGGENFPDALSAGPVAALAEAPLLLTMPGGRPYDTRVALERLAPHSIVLLGGLASISAAAEEKIAEYLPGGTPYTWSTALPAATSFDGRNLSCADAAHCFLGAGDHHYDWTGAAWASRPEAITRPACTQGWCLGLVGVGLDARAWDGTAWGPVVAGPAMTGDEHVVQLSCPVAGWCMALTWAQDVTRVYVYKGGAWTLNRVDAGTSTGATYVRSLDCASPTFCVGTEQQLGWFYRKGTVWNGSSWATAGGEEFWPGDASTGFAPGQADPAVTCSVTSCTLYGMAFGGTVLERYTPSAPPVRVAQYSVLNIPGLACASDAVCGTLVAEDADGGSDVSWYHLLNIPGSGADWPRKPVRTVTGSVLGSRATLGYVHRDPAPPPASTWLDCPSESFCLAVGADGWTAIGTR